MVIEHAVSDIGSARPMNDASGRDGLHFAIGQNMLNILVSSNSLPFQSLLASLLKSFVPNAFVVVADDRHQALETNVKLRPQVILFDASLPTRNDGALIQQLKGDNVGGWLLLLSNQPYEECAQDGLAMGADGYLDTASEGFVEDLQAALTKISKDYSLTDVSP